MALPIQKARQEKPDLIILDIMMPGIDGYEVCQRLKADPKTAGIGVLMLTAKGKIDETGVGERGMGTRVRERLQGFDVGALDFLSKPITANVLLERVEALLWLG